MPFKVSYEEDGFLRQLGIHPEFGQPLAGNCTQVLVWHTQSYQRLQAKENLAADLSKLRDTNIPFMSLQGRIELHYAD